MAKTSYLQVEQGVLALLLINGSLLTRCKINGADFSQESHRIIFEAIEEVSNKGHTVDLVTVGTALEKKYRTVDMEYLINLVEKRVTVEKNIEHHCDKIRQASRLRIAMEIAASIQTQIELEDDCESVVETAIQKLMAIDSNVKNHEHTMADAVDAAIEAYQIAAEKGGLTGITTGLTELDEAMHGFHNSDFTVVGARPAMGKTALLFNFAHACPVSAGVFSAEQNYEQAGQRFIALDGEIDSQRLRKAKLNDGEFKKLSSVMTRLKSREIYFNDEPGINIISLKRQARMWKQNKGIKILFVDYIQKIKGSNNRMSKSERVSEVAGELKDLARELQIPVVALSQLKRAADELDGPAGPSFLSDSTDIENEADSIITLWKNKEMERNSQMLLHICKNRHGPTGDKLVNYIGKFFKFTDVGQRHAQM
jgi:replicative DNA helicase